jgi:hypothetical protein
MPTWPQILDFLRSYGPAIGLALTWGGILLAWWRRRRSWQRKSFIRQVNFSLNDIQNGTLTLRTLLEDDAKKVWLNDYGVALVLDAAAHTTVRQPFIAMRTEADQGYVLRAALNVLSERFAELHVARTLGVAARSAEYVFGLTCEKYGDIRTRKLRVIIARPELLESLFGANATWTIPGDGGTVAADGAAAEAGEPRTRTLRLEHRVHKDRLDTLRVMHRLWTSDKPRERGMLDTVELGLPE